MADTPELGCFNLVDFFHDRELRTALLDVEKALLRASDAVIMALRPPIGLGAVVAGYFTKGKHENVAIFHLCAYRIKSKACDHYLIDKAAIGHT